MIKLKHRKVNTLSKFIHPVFKASIGKGVSRRCQREAVRQNRYTMHVRVMGNGKHTFIVKCHLSSLGSLEIKHGHRSFRPAGYSSMIYSIVREVLAATSKTVSKREGTVTRKNQKGVKKPKGKRQLQNLLGFLFGYAWTTGLFKTHLVGTGRKVFSSLNLPPRTRPMIWKTRIQRGLDQA